MFPRRMSYRCRVYLSSIAFIWLLFFCFSQDVNYGVTLSPLRRPVEVGKKANRDILILVVLDATNDRKEYEFPLSTIECYAKKWNYLLRVVKNRDYKQCYQKDPMFRRHCISVKVMDENPEMKWLLFLDADIAVVNPHRQIEEYLDDDAYLIMYDRFAGWEIAMGSYLAKNTNWTRNFLSNFAGFEENVPKSFAGTDNGAIHAFILRELQPSLLRLARPCFRVWETSTGYDDLFLYEACLRSVLGGNPRHGKLLIIPKGRGWVRDGWITQSTWSLDRDFMLHGYKTSDRRELWSIPLVNFFTRMVSHRFMWYSFLKKDLDQKCHWDYEKSLKVSEKEIHQSLGRLYRQTQHRYWITLGRMSSRL